MEHEPEGPYDEHRAAVLLGVAPGDLRRLAQHLGLGRTITQAGTERMVFTYPELLRLSLLTARGQG